MGWGDNSITLLSSECLAKGLIFDLCCFPLPAPIITDSPSRHCFQTSHFQIFLPTPPWMCGWVQLQKPAAGGGGGQLCRFGSGAPSLPLPSRQLNAAFMDRGYRWWAQVFATCTCASQLFLHQTPLHLQVLYAVVVRSRDRELRKRNLLTDAFPQEIAEVLISGKTPPPIKVEEVSALPRAFFF